MSTREGPGRLPRAEVRRTLLDAAARVFARRGIEGASLEEVAAEAGLTKGAIYSNFAGKADLVEAVVESNLRSNLDIGLTAVQGGGSITERAEALGDELTRAMRAQHEWHLLFVELWQRAVRAEDREGTLMDHRRELHSTIRAAIADVAEETGTDLSLPPDRLATVLLALWHGFSMEQQIHPENVPDDLLGRVLALLVRPG